MTNPEAVGTLLRILSDYTDRITIGEADSGGYNPFRMERVFEETGLNDIAARHGATLVNLSHEPSCDMQVCYWGRRIPVPLPIRISMRRICSSPCQCRRST